MAAVNTQASPLHSGVFTMARRKRQRDGDEERAAQSEEVEKSPWADRLSLAATLIVVAVFAIFTGYLVGQYAVHWLASPILGEAREESPGTRVVSSNSVTPSSSSSTESGASTNSTTTMTSTTSSTSSGPTGGASSGQTVTTSVSASPPPLSSQTAQSTIYRVQVGRFGTQEDAARLVGALQAQAPDAWVVYDRTSGEYRVQAGAFSSKERADEFAATLARLGHDAYVVQ